MPTIQSAKQIAENALSTIGAFPASRAAPDPGELKKTLRWLEMLLNYQAAIRPIGSFWQVFDVPLEASVGDYELSDYADERGASRVFSAFIVDTSGDVVPLPLEFQSDAVSENLTRTGRPERATVVYDGDDASTNASGTLSVYPMPTQTEVDAGLVLRVRVETFHEKIDETGAGDEDIRLRPSWYLWITKRLAYEIGSGPVRRLAEGELARLEADSMKLENALLARDSVSPRPPVTEPMAGSVDDDFCTSGNYGRTR